MKRRCTVHLLKYKLDYRWAWQSEFLPRHQYQIPVCTTTKFSRYGSLTDSVKVIRETPLCSKRGQNISQTSQMCLFVYLPGVSVYYMICYWYWRQLTGMNDLYHSNASDIGLTATAASVTCTSPTAVFTVAVLHYKLSFIDWPAISHA